MIPAVWVALGVATTAVAGLAAWRRFTRAEDRSALPAPEGRLTVHKERKADGFLLSVELEHDTGLHIRWSQSLLTRGLAPLPGARTLADPVARRLLASGVVESALRPLEPLGDSELRGRHLSLRRPGRLGEAEAWLVRAGEALDKATPMARAQETVPASLAEADLQRALVDHPQLDHGLDAPCRAWIQDFATRQVLVEAPLRVALAAELHLRARRPAERWLQQAHQQWLVAEEGAFEAWVMRSFQVELPDRPPPDSELSEAWDVQGELPEAWSQGDCREALLVLAGLGAELDATRILLRPDLDDPKLRRKLVIVARAGRVLSGAG